MYWAGSAPLPYHLSHRIEQQGLWLLHHLQQRQLGFEVLRMPLEHREKHWCHRCAALRLCWREAACCCSKGRMWRPSSAFRRH